MIAFRGIAAGTLGSIAEDGGKVSPFSSGVLLLDSGMVHQKIAASLSTARICSVPSERKWEDGVGLRRASVSMRAAVVALLMDDVAGIEI